MKNLLETSDRLYDQTQRVWESHASKRTAALLLMVVYIVALIVIALLLLATFIFLGIDHGLAALRAESASDFFATFYTILVFCDILIVLVSMRYSNSYPVVFRNSGFALATVVLRLALAAPDYYNAILGVGAVLYILGLNAV